MNTEKHLVRRTANGYVALQCVACRVDILKTRNGNVVWVEKRGKRGPVHIVDVYWTCRSCDRSLRVHYESRGFRTTWKDIQYLITWSGFMANLVFAVPNCLQNGDITFDKVAFERHQLMVETVARVANISIASLSSCATSTAW